MENPESYKLRCSVVTPEASVFDAGVRTVILPAHDGLLGVLPGHAPLLCQLGTGLLRYRDANDTEHAIFIDAGFGHIRDNEITILTRYAVTAEQIDSAAAKQQLLQARSMPSTTIEDVARRSNAIRSAEFLIQLSQS